MVCTTRHLKGNNGRTLHCIGQDIGSTILHRKTLHVPLYRIFERKCCNMCSKTYIIIVCGLEVMHILLVMNSLTTEDKTSEYVKYMLSTCEYSGTDWQVYILGHMSKLHTSFWVYKLGTRQYICIPIVAGTYQRMKSIHMQICSNSHMLTKLCSQSAG